MPPANLRFSCTTFVGGAAGSWQVADIRAVAGEGLPSVDYIRIVTDPSDAATDNSWVLAGIGSNLRYTTARERTTLNGRSENLGRPAATMAALIPISKSDKWWSLAQDERLQIYRRSEHYKIGLGALPQIARKLYHSRDLQQPFDFLTWFEFAPEDSKLFDELLLYLRASEEWQYIDREVDIRMVWSPPQA
jgi:Chlorite dismutase